VCGECILLLPQSYQNGVLVSSLSRMVSAALQYRECCATGESAVYSHGWAGRVLHSQVCGECILLLPQSYQNGVLVSSLSRMVSAALQYRECCATVTVGLEECCTVTVGLGERCTVTVGLEECCTVTVGLGECRTVTVGLGECRTVTVGLGE
jgi:hypothetical protein